MTDVFLHNPRCSKSRAALELVRGNKAVVGRPPESVRAVL
jgi:arsenate reductase-like glutaredoxin family protein